VASTFSTGTLSQSERVPEEVLLRMMGRVMLRYNRGSCSCAHTAFVNPAVAVRSINTETRDTAKMHHKLAQQARGRGFPSTFNY